MRAPFISIEGLDGAGKSTAISIIENEWKLTGVPMITTREPGGTPIAEELRFLLKNKREDEDLSIEAETLIFYASRSQNVENVIKPALKRGEAVLCDRFADSTMAYQSARGLDINKIKAIHNAVLGNFKPDLTIYLDVDLETSKERMGDRGDGYDRIENDADKFFNKARANYLSLAKAEPERFAVIDAKADIETVSENVRKVINRFIYSLREESKLNKSNTEKLKI